MKNLDALCAKTALGIENLCSKKSENDRKSFLNKITNGISILQEDGIYAFYLFLKREKIKSEVWDYCRQMLLDQSLDKIISYPKNLDDEDAIIKMTENLDALLLAKDLMQRMLIYARYGIRSREKN
ncbi:MAG: hypothetical protein SCK70_02580 [bacterium]|nr:hypothetical protein [bacterium]